MYGQASSRTVKPRESLTPAAHQQIAGADPGEDGAGGCRCGQQPVDTTTASMSVSSTG
jgi:hypothetical protein